VKIVQLLTYNKLEKKSIWKTRKESFCLAFVNITIETIITTNQHYRNFCEYKIGETRPLICVKNGVSKSEKQVKTYQNSQIRQRTKKEHNIKLQSKTNVNVTRTLVLLQSNSQRRLWPVVQTSKSFPCYLPHRLTLLP